MHLHERLKLRWIHLTFVPVLATYEDLERLYMDYLDLLDA